MTSEVAKVDENGVIRVGTVKLIVMALVLLLPVAVWGGTVSAHMLNGTVHENDREKSRRIDSHIELHAEALLVALAGIDRRLEVIEGKIQ